jgi:hypothetical protein
MNLAASAPARGNSNTEGKEHDGHYPYQPQRFRDRLQPGTSALFMMIQHVTPDKAVASIEQYGGTVIKTSLSDEDAKKLQDALQPPPTPAGA